MVILTNLYRPLKYHREQIKSSKTKYSLESEWKNAEILCNHVSQCPNPLLFRLNSEWGKSWNCGRTGNRNNIRNDAGKEVHDIFTDRNCNVYQHIWGCIQEYFYISLLQGLQYYFPENFRCNITYYESENFTDSFLHPKILSVHFCTKICSARAVKCEKLNFRKS